MRGRPPAVRHGLAAAALAVVLALPGAAQNLGSSQAIAGLELSAQTQQALASLVEQFRQWIVAVEQADAERAGQLVEQLRTTALDLGFEHQPDLAAAAAVLAAEEIKAGRLDRAALAIQAGRAFDPASPEPAFAAAALAARQGHHVDALLQRLHGVVGLAALPTTRSVLNANLVLWSISTLLLAGVLFLVLQVIVKGGCLLRDVVRLWSGLVSPGAALPFALLLLLWPLALPHGPLWLVLYWSLLLWGYGSPSERLVFAALWLAMGVAPVVLSLSRHEVAQHTSPPVVALDSIERSRLYGGLFADLGVLRTRLPDSTAVGHLTADLHLRLGQWDRARSLYQELLAKEESPSGILLNLGAYSFVTGDPANAAIYFKKAALADPNDPAPYYNLSLAYGDQYYFTEATQAHNQAELIDRAKVAAWDRQGKQGGARVQTSGAGIARIAEIRQALAAGTGEGEQSIKQSPLVEHGLTLFLALGSLVVAVTLDLVRRPFGYAEPPIDLRLERSTGEKVVRALLVGLAPAELGEGFRTFGAALLLAVLCRLPAGSSLYRMPIGFDPALGGLLWGLAIAGFVLLLGLRLVPALRAESTLGDL